jgi:glutaredoxin 3
MSSGKEYVASLIDDKKVLVISKSTCPHCREAKKVFKTYKIKKDQIQFLEINNRDDMNQIQNYMQSLTGARSVPRVFIDGEFIGGNDDTKTMHRNGKLKKALQEAGVLEDD